MMHKERRDSGGDLVTGACAMSSRWSLSEDYSRLLRYTVTTLIADDAIPERATKQGLPLLFQKGACPLFS